MKVKILVLLVVFVLAASSVFAATVTIRPDGAGHRKGWANVGCSSGNSEWECVDEVTLDTSDYLRTTGTRKETFNFGSTGLGTETINSVTMYYEAMEHNSASNSCFEAMVRSGGTDYQAGTQMCVGTTWETVSHTYTTNPATGSAWTVSEVDALEAGMRGLNPDGGGRVAQVWAVVDYVEPDLFPSVSASATPTSGLEPLNVDFNATGTGGDAPLSYLWQFGDGTNSTSEDPSHTYTSFGVYNATVTVTDVDGDSDVDHVIITVDEDTTPTANASGSPLSGYEPLNVSFTGGVTSGNSPYTFFWNFTDGGTSTQQNPSHTFLGGVFNVLFRVTDDDGDSDTDSVTVTVDYCGDNTVNGPETCDGTDLDGETCVSQGFDGGTLGCNSGCGSFDTSGCWDNTCSDTDGGINIFVAGNVTGDFEGSPYSNSDFCLDGTTVLEYSCSGGLAVSSNSTCVTNSTTSCSAGRCI